MRGPLRPWWALALAVLCLGGPPASGQEAVALTEGDDLAGMQRRVSVFIEALVDYTRDVRLTEAGLESVLDHYAALEEIHGEEEAQQIVERAFQGDAYDFGVVVADPTYQGWCRERGLEPEAFFRQFLRLQALWMREESLAGLTRALEELPGQRAQVDAAREEMGRESHGRAVAALNDAEAMIVHTRALMEELPVPEGDEAALLAEHDDRIRDTLGEDGPVPE